MNIISRQIALHAAAIALYLSPAFAGAMVIDKTVDVSVYQVCTADGINCAGKGPIGNEYYAAETNKIWAQAGINITFTFKQQLLSDEFYNANDNIPGSTFDELYESVFGLGSASTNTSSIDMFLVNSYDGAYGVGYSGFGGLIMSMQDIAEFDCGGAAGCTGRVDTLAHEIGHNFGLVPETFADYAGEADAGHSLDPNSLMASGEIRNVPTDLNDIAPDGFGLDFLPQTHIDLARQSTLLTSITPVPEPTSSAMMGLGLLALGLLVRQRKA